VDKYIADDFERSGNSSLSISKPLVIGDAEALPFATGTFAYAIASHVLEHATDPVLFANELSRIAQAGYVQVPSREAELTFGWPFHPWLIDLVDDTLVFCGRGSAAAPVGHVFHEAATRSKLFALWFAQHRSTFHHSVEWKGELKVRRVGGTPSATTAQFDVEETKARLAELAGFGLRGPCGEVARSMRCPVDGGYLEPSRRQGDEVLECAECERAYPVVGGVPLLLQDAAV